MSEIQTPTKEIVSASGVPISIPQTDVEDTKPAQLPDVKGYRIFCAVPQVEDSYKSGLLKSDKTKDIEEHSTVVLFVMKLGDTAYKDEARFPTGAWCKEGDFVITRAYSGTRIKIFGNEFRIKIGRAHV